MNAVGGVTLEGDAVGPLGAEHRVVRDLMADLLGGHAELADHTVAVRAVKLPRVYRWTLRAGAPWRSVVLKRLDPEVARRTRSVAERWLPALGLEGAGARLLASAGHEGEDVWHVYEDLGDATLATDPRPVHVRRTVDLVVRLHTSAAEHPVLAEALGTGRALGIGYFEENVAEAVRALRALARRRRA